jgi:hypothetical protein
MPHRLHAMRDRQQQRYAPTTGAVNVAMRHKPSAPFLSGVSRRTFPWVGGFRRSCVETFPDSLRRPGPERFWNTLCWLPR